MKTYTIEVKETLSKIIKVKAESLDGAIFKVKDLYKKEKIVLSAADYVETEFLELESVNTEL